MSGAVGISVFDAGKWRIHMTRSSLFIPALLMTAGFAIFAAAVKQADTLPNPTPRPAKA
jgi:hypothetical protein